MLNHVALLVRSVDQAAKNLAQIGCHVGPKEEWDGEGTAEIYVGSNDQTSKLLLMEPIKCGAYSRAMEKRGPGLHHIAIDVTDLEGFVDGLSGSGWYLHPKSLLTIKKTRTAWLVRPGTPMLIEVQEQKGVNTNVDPFITRLEIPLSKQEHKMIAALRIEAIRPADGSEIWFEIGQKRITLKDVLI